jgi:hypothetical protein
MYYGIFSNILFFFPVVVGTWLYFGNNEGNLWSLHWVLLLSYTGFFSWFGLGWILFLFQDNIEVRYNMLNALYWTKRGIYAVNWAGIMNWLMIQWESNKSLLDNVFTFILFLCWFTLYFFLVMADTHIAPTVEYWLLNAPFFNRMYNEDSLEPVDCSGHLHGDDSCHVHPDHSHESDEETDHSHSEDDHQHDSTPSEDQNLHENNREQP